MLNDKKILVTGLLSSRSIAYGIASAAKREGATLMFTYAGEKLKDRVAGLASEFTDAPVLACDVSSDEEIAGRRLAWTLHLRSVVSLEIVESPACLSFPDIARSGDY